MVNRILMRGSTGPDVKRLQEGLNIALKPSPGLVPDGIFGNNTYMAVRFFQDEFWLVVDGIAGPCTLNALFDTEAYDPIHHDIPMMAQPTQTTCWATSTAMINNSTIPAVMARTPANLLLADGSLRNESENDDPGRSGRPYAQAHNLWYHGPMSWRLSYFQQQLTKGPLMLDMLWDAKGYTTKDPKVPGQFIGSSGHMIVVVGMRGDGDESGKGTSLYIHDPWPPTFGDAYAVNYFKWINQVATRTYRVFQAQRIPMSF